MIAIAAACCLLLAVAAPALAAGGYCLRPLPTKGGGMPSSHRTPRTIAASITVMTALVTVALWLGLDVAHAPAKTSTAKTTVSFRETQQTVAIKTDAGFPGVGTHQLQAGVLATKSFGKGDKAQIFRVTMTKAPSATRLAFTVEGTDFFADGTQIWRAQGVATIAANGSITTTGTGKYTGGTGRYRGASGPFTFTGEQASGDPVTNTSSKGKITF